MTTAEIEGGHQELSLRYVLAVPHKFIDVTTMDTLSNQASKCGKQTGSCMSFQIHYNLIFDKSNSPNKQVFKTWQVTYAFLFFLSEAAGPSPQTVPE